MTFHYWCKHCRQITEHLNTRCVECQKTNEDPTREEVEQRKKFVPAELLPEDGA